MEVESLTLLSIIGTLHANVPQIEQVRFVVDGQPRETLAGHADLLRTYPSRDTSIAELDQAIAGTRIAPCTTNLEFLRKVLASDEFRAGKYDTKFAEVLAKR